MNIPNKNNSGVTKLIKINRKGKKNIDYIFQEIDHKTVFVISSFGEPFLFAQKLVNRINKKNKTTHVEFIQIASASITKFKQIKKTISGSFNEAVIIAVGGGSCIDMAKAVSKDLNLDVYVYPTVLSSDCLVSPVSVLIDDESDAKGDKLRVAARNPSGIFVDTGITKIAPRKLILSGVFDLISNASAILDLEFNTENSSENISYATFLSRTAIDGIIYASKFSEDTHQFQNQLAKGLILSGIAMQISGDSSPASGGEHLVSHALDKLNYGNATHGEQVYLGMLCVREIRKHFEMRLLKNKYFKFLDNLGASNKLAYYGLTIEMMAQAVKLGPSLRIERATSLNATSNLTIEEISHIICKAFK